MRERTVEYNTNQFGFSHYDIKIAYDGEDEDGYGLFKLETREIKHYLCDVIGIVPGVANTSLHTLQNAGASCGISALLQCLARVPFLFQDWEAQLRDVIADTREVLPRGRIITKSNTDSREVIIKRDECLQRVLSGMIDGGDIDPVNQNLKEYVRLCGKSNVEMVKKLAMTRSGNEIDVMDAINVFMEYSVIQDYFERFDGDDGKYGIITVSPEKEVHGREIVPFNCFVTAYTITGRAALLRVHKMVDNIKEITAHFTALGRDYELVSFITNLDDKHFVAYVNNVMGWYKLDDRTPTRPRGVVCSTKQINDFLNREKNAEVENIVYLIYVKV